MSHPTHRHVPSPGVPAAGAAVPETVAAIDLGSNSFHMIVGELRHGQLTIIANHPSSELTVLLCTGSGPDQVADPPVSPGTGGSPPTITLPRLSNAPV